MKLNITKEWFESRVELERDCDISAGNPDLFHIDPSPQPRLAVARQRLAKAQEEYDTADQSPEGVRSYNTRELAYAVRHVARAEAAELAAAELERRG